MQATALTGPAPDFLILGAQKCGTSWLFERLRQHPQVFMPAIKELEFFSYLPHVSQSEAYFDHFKPGRGALARGEASASYFWTRTGSEWAQQPAGFNLDIPGTVQALLGRRLKLLLCLRDPVERAVSAYAHYVAHGELPPTTTFEEALGYGGIVDMGFYGRHLQNWLAYYPLEQFMVLRIEDDIALHAQQSLQRVQAFLGLDASPPDDSANQVTFPGSARRSGLDGSVHFAAPAHHPGQLLPAQPISAACLARLRELYRPDVLLLEQLLGRSMATDWGF